MTNEAGNQDPAGAPSGQPAAAGAPAGQPAAGGAPAQAGSPPAAGAAPEPIRYDLKWSDKLAVGDELAGQFTATFGSHGVTPEAAQAIVDQLPAALEAAHAEFLKSQDAQHADQVKAWEAQARAAPDIGGPKFDAVMASAQAAVARFGDDEVKVLLEASGLGSHPAFIRLLAKVNSAIAEGSHVGGGGPAPVVSAAESIYTHPTSRKSLKFG